MASNATIYNLGNVKICNNGIIDLEEQSLRYRMFVSEDLIIQFKTNFDPQDDFSFVVEIISDGSHIISFNANINPKMSLLPINRGMTKIYVTKKIGVPYYDVEISRLDAPEPTLLTPNFGDDINSELCVSHNGCDWNAHDMLKTNTDNINFSGREFYFEFNTLVVVDYVYFFSRYTDQALDEFYLKGSNDKQNWTTLLYKNEEKINGKIFTDLKCCFRYFKLYIGWENDNYLRAMQLWGTQIDNNESELILLTPKMSSDTTGFAKLTYSNLDEGSAGDLTDASASTSIYVKYSTDTSDLFRWIKYEFPEAVIANFLDVAAHKDNLNRTMRWYKLEGSNDDENWTLLLERQYQRDFYQYETRWHNFQNSTAYKFYKLTCLATNGDQYWRIARFRLFRRDIGKWNFIRGVPKLSSAYQDGYRLWGNRSTINEGAYKFLCVRRTADIISDSILQSHLWAVDRNIVKNYLTDVTENVNAFLAKLKSQGAILDGKCVANKELNTAANITEGKVYFDFEFTPAYPAEQVTFSCYLNNDDVETILLENLAR